MVSNDAVEEALADSITCHSGKSEGNTEMNELGAINTLKLY
jgi:hypothetical protein